MLGGGLGVVYVLISPPLPILIISLQEDLHREVLDVGAAGGFVGYGGGFDGGGGVEELGFHLSCMDAREEGWRGMGRVE